MLRIHVITSFHFVFAYKLPRLKIKRRGQGLQSKSINHELLVRKYKNQENIVISATINQIERNERD